MPQMGHGALNNSQQWRTMNLGTLQVVDAGKTEETGHALL